MAGILAYAREFVAGAMYGGGETGEHYEVEGIGGDFESVSNVRWGAMRTYCEAHGVPRDAWPHFFSSIDMDLEELRRKNEGIRKHISRLSPEAIEADRALALVCSLIRGGMQFYFSETD